MNCANPACGHNADEHVLSPDDLEREECLVGLFGGQEEPCQCRRFLQAREPLLVQLEAVLRTRAP